MAENVNNIGRWQVNDIGRSRAIASTTLDDYDGVWWKPMPSAWSSAASGTDFGILTIAPGETRMTQRTSVEDMVDLIMDRMYGQHCGKAVVACRHCGQWGARFCACKHCGAPVD